MLHRSTSHFAKRLTVLLLTGWRTVEPDIAAGADDHIGWQARGTHGAVSAGGAAVAAGLETLRGGGNAADAAVATILALSVVESNQFCFGGEVPILVYDANRNVVEVVAGMGAAPELETREFFESQGGIPGSVETSRVLTSRGHQVTISKGSLWAPSAILVVQSGDCENARRLRGEGWGGGAFVRYW